MSVTGGCIEGLSDWSLLGTGSGGQISLMNISHANVTVDSANVVWEVAGNGVSWIEFGSREGHAENVSLPFAGPGIHGFTLQQLRPNTTYWYEVKVGRDPQRPFDAAAGRLVTLRAPPAIARVSVEDFTWSTATFSWTLEDAETDVVSIVETAARTANATGEWVVVESVVGRFGLTAEAVGLAPNATYDYRVRAKHPGSLEVSSSVGNFTTSMKPLVADIVGFPRVEFTSAFVEWWVDGPVGSIGGLELRPDQGNWTTVALTNSSLGGFNSRVEPLEPAWNYSVRSWIIAPDSSKLTSPAVGFTTPWATVIVRNLTVSKAGPDSARFSWEVFGDDSALTQLEMVSPGGVKRHGSAWTGPGTMEDVLDRLEPGFEYRFRVDARAADGFRYQTPYLTFVS